MLLTAYVVDTLDDNPATGPSDTDAHVSLREAIIAANTNAPFGDAPAGQRTVLLKVHREVQALYYEPVIEAISEAGGDLVHVLEEQKE